MKVTVIAVAVLLVGVTACAELPEDIVAPYLRIQLALANDSTNGVTDAAASIVVEAKKLGDAANMIAVTAQSMVTAIDIESTRSVFGPLSDALIKYGEDVGFGELKVAYCPMVQKFWVQEDGDIINPFYGSAMLNCGTLTR